MIFSLGVYLRARASCFVLNLYDLLGFVLGDILFSFCLFA